MKVRIASRGPKRVLDFDCEVRPLSYYAGDFTTGEITAIAAQWIGDERIHCWVQPDLSVKEILENFVKLYDEADMVTGHYIRGFDLPVLNGALLEQGMAPLSSKLTQDTKMDLIKMSKLSKSQENLGAILGLKHPKVGMDQAKWRAANRLTPAGVRETRNRVEGDVAQHVELRAELLRRHMLRAPRMWNPDTSGLGNYHP